MVFVSEGLFYSRGNAPSVLVLRWRSYNRDVDLQCTSVLEQAKWWHGCASLTLILPTILQDYYSYLLRRFTEEWNAMLPDTVKQVRMLTYQEKMFYFSTKTKQNLTTLEFLLIILVRVPLVFLHVQSIALTECLMGFLCSVPFQAASRMIIAKYFLHITYLLKITPLWLIFFILNCKLCFK